MSISPKSPVTALAGIGQVIAHKLKKMNIATIDDILWHIPFRYEDWRNTTTISRLSVGQEATLQVTIQAIANRRAARRRMTVTEAMVSDGTGSIHVIWFNQPFLLQNLRVGETLFVSGKVTDRFGTLQLTSPAYEKIPKGETTLAGWLMPVYSTTASITQKQWRMYTAQAMRYAHLIADALPEKLREQENLPTIANALRMVHFPDDEYQRDQGLYRLQFDELLKFALDRLLAERNAPKRPALALPFQEEAVREFVQSLPFQLTPAQKKAAWDILNDTKQRNAMNRLVQGDVGSGKTVVATIAAVNSLMNGSSVLLMAPTEILAAQHFQTIASLLSAYSLPVLLSTSKLKRKSVQGRAEDITKTEMRELLSAETPAFVIGTHALINDAPHVHQLGLVVVDEQHRFGVGQRYLLHAQQEGRTPHFLSLTATPIPRSLALVLFGELEVSIIKSLPPNRKSIATRYMRPEQRDEAYAFAKREIAKGRQVFVVAPMIETSDTIDISSVNELFAEMPALLPKARYGLLHGKLKADEKEAILKQFAAHELDVLVATAVVEVGIDIPNASVMIIEGAERFGLAQLHQLRGRVGRGTEQSSCFLIASHASPMVAKRLQAVANTSDGFALAQTDLTLRGPGDLIGTTQSGFLDFRFAHLGNIELIEHVHAVAKQLMQNDPELRNFPLLRKGLQSPGIRHRE